MISKNIEAITQDWDQKIIEKLLKASPELLCAIDESGRFVYVSETSEKVLGYKSAELLHRNCLDFVSPLYRCKTVEALQFAKQRQAINNFVNCYVHPDGSEIPLSWKAVWSEDDKMLYCQARDASDLIAVGQKLQEKDEWHKVLVQHGSDMICLLNEVGDYLYVEGQVITRILNYTPEQLIGRNIFQLIHPDDVELAQTYLAYVLENEVVHVPDLRFLDADGEWRWVEAIVSNQLSNPAVKAIVVSSRDITDRKRASLKLEESEKRFRSLFDNNPDQVTFEECTGTVLDANPKFVAFAGKTKEEVIGKNITEFIPLELRAECLEYLKQAFEGKICSFYLDIPRENNEILNLHITKVPVSINGKVVGVHSIAKDITEVQVAHLTILKQAESLRTVFESITDAFYMLDRNWCFQLMNSEFERLLNLNREECLGKNIWEVFPESDYKRFYKDFNQAIQTKQAVHFETYLNRLDMWFEVKAFPSEEGLSVYLSDITERVQAQKELEKLSLVASKITNGVMITDAHHRIEWVNEAFTRNTGYALEEVKGVVPGSFLRGPDSDPEVGRTIDEKLKQGVAFNAMIQCYHKNGNKFWVSMDVTPIFDEGGELERYITIQKDITLRKEAEERQLEMTRDLYRQNSDLQQFTYIVSHNLRAPVANAMGLADLLTKADKTTDMYDKSLTALKTSVFKMDTVLRDLNLILSVRDQKEVLDREKVAVAEVCEQVRQYFLESLAHHKGEVSIEIDPALRIDTNRAYIYSIFYNLLSNAIKYRAEGRALQVNICCNANAEGGAEICFSDNGSGFDMEKAGDNVFKLYKRFHTNKKGRGMGLFLVKTHVESMGGTIDMISKLGEGTQVKIQLPG